MSKVLLLLFTILATTSCCDLPEFNVLVEKRDGKEKNISYSKQELKDYDYVTGDQINVPVLCAGIYSDLNLVTIHMVGSNIQQIEKGAISNMPKLLNLMLLNNKIQTIEDGVLDNEKLEWVNLGGNSIRKISSKAFSKLPNLMLINLVENKLNYVDVNWFKNNPKLQTVYLNKNKIVHIPQGFLKYRVLHVPMEVDLMGNPIETIADAAFENMESLFLNLEQTRLKKVSKMFEKVEEVEVLLLDSDKEDCYSQEELNNIKIAKKLIVREKYLPIGCFQSLQVWGQENDVLVENNDSPRQP